MARRFLEPGPSGTKLILGEIMESTELFLVCGAAFLWVFTILIVLALLMRIIIVFFPEKKISTEDTASVIAAVAAALHSVFPGTKITKIEEKK